MTKSTIQIRFGGDPPADHNPRMDAQRRAYQKAGFNQHKAKKNRRDWR